MLSFEQLQRLIEEELQELKFDRKPESLYQPVTYILSFGGKRIRPVLALMSAQMFGISVREALKPSLALEVFHNFTLMHDDIMDNATLRRGKQTVHEKWGDSTAILSGDVMLVLAYDLLMEVNSDKLKPVLDLFNETAIKVCEGQQLDMDFENRTDVTIPDYLNMIGHKTAALLAGSLKMGAVLAGADPSNADRLYRFGWNLGISFQLQDDYLDVFGEPEEVGKKKAGDITSNKKTYLLLKAFEKANPKQKEELVSWLNITDKDEYKIKAVTEIYNQLGVGEDVKNEMEVYYYKALESINSINVPLEAKQPLLQLAVRLMDRQK